MTVYLDESGLYDLTLPEVDSGSLDACGIDSMWLSQTVFGCDDLGLQVVTITAIDSSGNMSSCVSQVTVLDTISPSMICQDVTIYLDESGLYDLTLAEVDSGSIDVCGIDSIWLSQTAFGCDDLGQQVVTITAIDSSGNIGSCASQVTVLDTISPSMICQDVTVYLDESGLYDLTLPEVDSGSIDACGIESKWLSQTAFGCGDLGQQVVALTAIDLSLIHI